MDNKVTVVVRVHMACSDAPDVRNDPARAACAFKKNWKKQQEDTNAPGTLVDAVPSVEGDGCGFTARINLPDIDEDLWLELQGRIEKVAEGARGFAFTQLEWHGNKNL